MTRQVKLIGKKKFATVALDRKYKTFIVYVATLSIDSGNEIYLSKKTQIAYLKANKALTKVSSKYANFADIFLPKWAVELLKYTKINNHTIKLVDDLQYPYSLIYSLSLVK